MRTNDLKELVQEKLKTVCANVYHERALDNAIYPHIVFNFERVELGDLSRQDYVLAVDVWDKTSEAHDTTTVDDLTDSVENFLQAENLPQDNVLPTFYLIDRKNLLDQDKDIRHRLVRFQIQNYER